MITSKISLVLALASANGQVPCEQPVCDGSQPAVLAVEPASPDVLTVTTRPEETPQSDGTQVDNAPPLQAEEQESAPEAAPVEQTDGGPDQTAQGQIIVTGNAGPPKGDPVEELNVATFETVQAIDDAVVAPVAEAYDEGMPKPVRKGLRNFLRNLGEPINFLNFMLQMKVGKAFETLGRFAINSTFGVAGLFDQAKKEPFNLPYRPNGFANTLGFYGVGPGPYLYLPFIGSTTVRDLFGRGVDLAVLPYALGAPFNDPLYSIPLAGLNSLETRILIDGQIRVVRDECGDPYAGTRDIYLITRQIEIDSLRGKELNELSELTERLSLNCDIEAVRTAYGDLYADNLTVNTDPTANTAAPVEQGVGVPAEPAEVLVEEPHAVEPTDNGTEPPVDDNEPQREAGDQAAMPLAA